MSKNRNMRSKSKPVLVNPKIQDTGVAKSLTDINKVVPKKPDKKYTELDLFELLELRKLALSIYTPPFKFHRGYIWDSSNHVVADQGGLGPNDDATTEAAVITRIRGWGRISYMEQADNIQDMVGTLTADALNLYYRLHETGNINGKLCQGKPHEGCAYTGACGQTCNKCGTHCPDCSGSCNCKVKPYESNVIAS